MSSSRFAYIQARLQARHGLRPGDDRWRLLESATDLGGYLQQARNTAMASWVQHLRPQANSHQVEESLRRAWRAYAKQIASWAPADWREAIAWTGDLADLPMIAHLARGGSVRPWMLADAVLAPLALEDAQHREAALKASRFSWILVPGPGPQSPTEAWLNAWTRTWPPGQGVEDLLAFKAIFEDHIHRMLGEPAAQPMGPGLRADLVVRLTSLFRREAGRIGAVLAHLGLMLVDLERLRGGLVLRALFPSPAGRPRWT